MRNENLLKTVMVKSQLKLWRKEWKLSYDEILYKLADIHLIVITKDELKEFLKKI